MKIALQTGTQSTAIDRDEIPKFTQFTGRFLRDVRRSKFTHITRHFSEQRAIQSSHRSHTVSPQKAGKRGAGSKTAPYLIWLWLI
ncbi:MAG: hypothetical protein ABJP02_02710 [Parasphingorhabdus sp.]|uniref:hypothetical protein n=1 Tax=Parasphingorhabdus sp. TaxID=2709688 RepID=UPI00329A445C